MGLIKTGPGLITPDVDSDPVVEKMVLQFLNKCLGKISLGKAFSAGHFSGQNRLIFQTKLHEIIEGGQPY